MKHSPRLEERLLHTISLSNWILLIVLSFAAAKLKTWFFGWSLFIGGLIISVSFLFLYRTLKKSFSRPTHARFGVVMIKYYLRFLASVAIIFLLISRHLADPIGLLIGLSIVVISIFIGLIDGAIHSVIRHSARHDAGEERDVLPVRCSDEPRSNAAI
ncbi:MAG: ATP synthase subunit I [Pseudomonadota bacterium]